jgi:hypothetical protein
MNDNAIILKGHVDRYNLMVDYVKTIMVKERDYGIVPGTAKPTLLKPGAEKLNSLFNLYPVWKPVSVLTDWDKGLFFYQYECVLVHRATGETWGSGLGSCNSKESKYRYRYVASEKKPTKEEAAELKARGLGRWRKVDNAWVWMERIENDQVYDIVNTIDKMAQKRALIAATLIACNASEFFTQDVEDIPGFADEDIVEGQVVEPPKAPPAEPAPDVILPELEHLAGVCNSEGIAYPLIASDKLAHMSKSIGKRLAENHLTDEQRDELTIKQNAIAEILKVRNA